jgi:hypothetical protein
VSTRPCAAARAAGWLSKADPKGSKWQPRWAVLMPSSLLYYSSSAAQDGAPTPR